MTGYFNVADFMSTHGEVAIFRRFAKLNMLNLLYSQAEITRLEHELGELATHNPNVISAKDWVTLYIQLLQQAAIMKLEQPNRYSIEFLRNWLTDIGQGDFPLLGRDQHAWNEDADLLSLQQQPEYGPFSYVLSYKIIPLLYRYLGSSRTGDREIADSTLATVANILGCVVASLLPLTSILALYFIQDELKRLFATIGFAGIFCLAVLIFTHARLIEVFAATSAFAAVLVVYVANT